MNDKLSSRHILIVLLLAVPAMALLVSGCEEFCSSTERSYQQALAAEQTELAEPESLSAESPAQFGLSMKTSLIGDILDIVPEPTLKAALRAVSSIEIGGERVELTSAGNLVSL